MVECRRAEGCEFKVGEMWASQCVGGPVFCHFSVRPPPEGFLKRALLINVEVVRGVGHPLIPAGAKAAILQQSELIVDMAMRLDQLELKGVGK